VLNVWYQLEGRLGVAFRGQTPNSELEVEYLLI